MLPILGAGIFFVFGEIFLSVGGWFWPAAAMIFSFWFFSKNNKDVFANSSVSLIFSLILIFGLILSGIFISSLWFRQIPVFILAGIFFGLACLAGKKADDWRLRFFPAVLAAVAAVLAGWFFWSGAIEFLFLKEIILFFVLAAIFRAGQKVFFKIDSGGESEILSSWISLLAISLVLAEMAWLLGFLPVNFLSLAGVWLLSFYFALDVFISFWKGGFSWPSFWRQAVWLLILAVFILSSATWKIF